MMKKIKTLNLNLNWVLFLTAPLFIAVLFIFRFSPHIEFCVLIFTALIYLAVAILHHLKDKTLTLEIIIEYVLIATLALIILQGLIL